MITSSLDLDNTQLVGSKDYQSDTMHFTIMRVVAIMMHICSIGPDLTIDKWGTCHISFAMDSSDVSICIYKLGYAQII